MVILQFIFFVFVFIVVMALVTVLRIITGLNKTRRKFMDFGRQQQNTTDAYNQNPKSKKQIFADDAGEYVDFTEVQ